jgi:predicted dehydrogenase
MSIIRTGIIGQGNSGHDIHASALHKLPDQYRIVAVSDALEERRSRAEAEFGCETHADYRDMLRRGDLDLVVNATPSHLHVPVTLEILEAGIHALCEKPLARRAIDVDRLIGKAREKGKSLAIFQQSRYMPAFEKIRDIIRSGAIGRVVQAGIAYNQFARRWDWQTMQERGGGNLLNTGPHPLDQALQLFGPDRMPEVNATMDRANSFGDAEDYVKIALTGPHRPLVEVEISSCCAYPGETYRVQGTRGGIKATFTAVDWKYFKPEEAPERELISTTISTSDGRPAFCREQLVWHEERWEAPEEAVRDVYGTMALKYYRMLHRTLSDGEPLEITPAEVRLQIAVMEECFRQNADFARKHTF